MSLDTIKTVVSYLGAIGLGSLFGIFLNNYFLSRENKKKLLFEARVKAYSGLVSRFFNLFNELDINRLEEALRFVKINEILSEAYLLGSRKFVEKLGKFKPNLLAFHRELDEVVRNKKKDESRAVALHQDLMRDIGAIYNQMRTDLFIEEVQIDELQIDGGSISAFQLRGLSKEEIARRHDRTMREVINVKRINDEIQNEEQEPIQAVAEEQVPIEETSYKELLPKIEEKALAKFSVSIGKELSKQVSFADLPLEFDGVSIDNEMKLLRFVEVKVFPHLPRNRYGKIMTFAIMESLRKTLSPVIATLAEYLKQRSALAGWEHVFTVAVVLNTKTEFVRIRKRIEELKEELAQIGAPANLKVNFVFYNLKNMNLDLTD